MSALHPTFPANAGTQFQAERLGCSRLPITPAGLAFMCSIWAPAFAGETGEGDARG